MTTAFSALLASSTTVGDALELAVPDDWTQGRSVFGGLQAALAVQAMRAHVDGVVPLRTLQITFVAPASGTLRARANVLRRGGSATHVEVRLCGGDNALAMIALGVFGVARTSAVAVMPAQVAVTAAPRELPYLPGVVPAFLQHFEARWLRGGLPFSGTTERSHVIEVDLRDDVATASEAHVIALADYPPPLALSFLRTVANGSTLTWMLELVGDGLGRHGLARWRIDAEVAAARDGYTSQSLVLWAPDGSPVAFGHQSMVVFG